MSDRTVATTITLVSVNHIDGGEVESMMERHEADGFDEVAENLGQSLELMLRERVFGDADEIPLLDVDTNVYEEWDSVSSEELSDI